MTNSKQKPQKFNIYNVVFAVIICLVIIYIILYGLPIVGFMIYGMPWFDTYIK